MEQGYKKQKQILKHQGRIVSFYEDVVTLPNGKTVHWDYVKHPGAAAIVPVTKEGKILLVKQYRNALDCYTMEIPAGGIEPGEKPMECAIREVEEETGYAANQVEPLIEIVTAIGFCDERVSIFLAQGLSTSSQNLDEDEFIDVLEYGLDEMKKMILSGEIYDAKTIAGVLAYEAKKNQMS